MTTAQEKSTEGKRWIHQERSTLEDGIWKPEQGAASSGEKWGYCHRGWDTEMDVVGSAEFLQLLQIERSMLGSAMAP